MQWSETIEDYLHALKPLKKSDVLIQKLIRLTDFTSLNDTDSDASIAAFCEKAKALADSVAALCVYPQFVRIVATTFANTAIKTATVANFPEGNTSLEAVLIEINDAITDGATEIDVVFPYTRYLAGETHYGHDFVETCKAACGDAVTLKVILETGALIEPAIIADVSLLALEAGADFIKTSTGKIAIGATLEAAATMLLVIKHATPKLNRPLGFKASGGIRTFEQAVQYLELAENIMGKGWVTPQTFRIGASKLVEELLDFQM